ncbi:MAG: RNA-binding cell elongation regulator Jag/EloR [Chloroflexota bacterium]
MDEFEISGKTVEEATAKAEERLGMSRDEFEAIVVKQGKQGILGVGAEESVIRVRPKNVDNKDIGAVAKEILERLLELMDLSGEVQVSEGEMPVSVNVEGEDLGVLIGRRGQGLGALQYLVRLMVAARLGAWVPLLVDVCGYKKRRHESLGKLALRLADQVKARHRPITLEPMPADERRIIHLALADHPDVATHSIGEGDGRKVVILLKRE